MKGSHLAVVGHWARARLRWRLLRGSTLGRYQDWMARRIVEYARQNSPYYRDLFAGYGSALWQTLPTSDKAAMMAHFNDFNTRGIRGAEALEVAIQAERSRDFSPTIGDLTVGLSSGTSGNRGLFLVSPWEQAGWAGAILARTLPPIRLQGYRVALFHRSNSNLYEQLDSRWLKLRYYDLMIPLAEAIASLNETKPDVLVGPPSLLLLLSAARTSGKLRIRPGRIYSAAEVLEEQDRASIQDAFDVPVGQIYQCTEGLLAVTCDSFSLHLQEDLVAVQTEPLPGGQDEQRVTPIVTDLWRRVQPIIRYRLNDVLTLASRPCPCGSDFRVITRIEGRCDDVLYFPAKDGSLRPFFPDAIRRMILLSSSSITDYRAVQERPGHLRINLEVATDKDFGPVAGAVRRNVEESLVRYHCYPAVVELERGIPPGSLQAKLRRVQRVG